MNVATIIQIALALLRTVLTAANANGATQVVEGVSNAIRELEKVRDTPVTKAQVDSLTLTKLW